MPFLQTKNRRPSWAHKTGFIMQKNKAPPGARQCREPSNSRHPEQKIKPLSKTSNLVVEVFEKGRGLGEGKTFCKKFSPPPRSLFYFHLGFFLRI